MTDAIRTPDVLLEALPDFPWAPHFRQWEGIRLAHIDEGEGRLSPFEALSREPRAAWPDPSTERGPPRSLVIAVPDFKAPALRLDAVLLDNMSPDDLRKAVEMVAGKLVLEASGGITLETAAAVAKTGIDYLSSGAITHSAPSLDVALDIEM